MTTPTMLTLLKQVEKLHERERQKVTVLRDLLVVLRDLSVTPAMVRERIDKTLTSVEEM
jgi:hypothetical protein